jgi:hypothetical protein
MLSGLEARQQLQQKILNLVLFPGCQKYITILAGDDYVATESGHGIIFARFYSRDARKALSRDNL